MRHSGAICSSVVFAISFAVACGSLPVGAQSAPSTPMLQGGVSRTSASGSDVLVGAVIVTKNPHVHFTAHRDYVSGRVYEPGPTPQDYANAVNCGMGIFNTVMGIVDSCGGFSSGGSSCSSPAPAPRSSCPPPSYSCGSSSRH